MIDFQAVTPPANVGTGGFYVRAVIERGETRFTGESSFAAARDAFNAAISAPTILRTELYCFRNAHGPALKLAAYNLNGI